MFLFHDFLLFLSTFLTWDSGLDPVLLSGPRGPDKPLLQYHERGR